MNKRLKRSIQIALLFVPKRVKDHIYVIEEQNKMNEAL